MTPFLYLDLESVELTPVEIELLKHPLLDGIVLFARNYQSPSQLHELTQHIKTVNSNLYIAVDQEGGRVQRFRLPFTIVPAMGKFGVLYDRDSIAATALMKDVGWLVGAELHAMHIDINFAPVLDLDRGISEVIGDRAFHSEPEVVVSLAAAYCQGLAESHVLAVGKHFPGHGSVAPDSHKALPVDERTMEQISELDLVPFERMIASGTLNAMMMSHVIYSQVSDMPAGYSQQWVALLRERLNFKGLIFTDDLSMQAAKLFESTSACIKTALDSGCDKVLVCNYQGDKLALLEEIDKLSLTQKLHSTVEFFNASRLVIPWQELQTNERYQAVRSQLERM